MTFSPEEIRSYAAGLAEGELRDRMIRDLIDDPEDGEAARGLRELAEQRRRALEGYEPNIVDAFALAEPSSDGEPWHRHRAGPFVDELKDHDEVPPDISLAFGPDWRSDLDWRGDGEAAVDVAPAPDRGATDMAPGTMPDATDEGSAPDPTVIHGSWGIRPYTVGLGSGAIAASLLFALAYFVSRGVATAPDRSRSGFIVDEMASERTVEAARKELAEVWSNPKGRSEHSRINDLIYQRPDVKLKTEDLVRALEDVQGERPDDQKAKETLKQLKALFSGETASGERAR